MVDDERYILDVVESILRAEGITNILALSDPRGLVAAMENDGVGIVLLDLTMPEMDGMELLDRIRRDHPNIKIIVITGDRAIDRAVECMRRGAVDYLAKPVEVARLVTSVRRAIDLYDLERENLDMRERLLAPRSAPIRPFEGIVTAGKSMGPVLAYAETIARSSHPVLITGETGVGKELFAKAVHDRSECEGEFVAVNVAGLDDGFFSDLLFGHRAGAYTGSQGRLEGLVERAKGGSLFLDEIGDLSQASQVKLLRVIESGEYYPLGSDLPKRSGARFIVATNRDLDAAMASGAFRKDLYYRLHAHHLVIPPLRERREDIPLLVERFLADSAVELSKSPPAPTPELFTLLRSYAFPGNVRELRSLVFEAVCASEGDTLSLAPFNEALGPAVRSEAALIPLSHLADSFPTLKEMTELLVDEALKRSGGNQRVAARLLGISPQAVSKRVQARRGGDVRGNRAEEEE